MLQHAYIETREMHQLHDIAVSEKTFQVRTVIFPPAEAFGHQLHQMRGTVAGGELHQAQSIPYRIEPHCLGIHGNDRAERQIRRQVVAMQGESPRR